MPITVEEERYVLSKVFLTVEEEGGVGELPPVRGKVRLNGRPTAYLCHRQTCSPPITEAEQLQGML
jgi:uncharacterized protein